MLNPLIMTWLVERDAGLVSDDAAFRESPYYAATPQLR